MAVQFLKHVAFLIPEDDQDVAMKFYTAFGLEGKLDQGLMSFRCHGRKYDALKLIPKGDRKKLHHVCMGTDTAGLDAIRQRAAAKGYEEQSVPDGFDAAGLWLRDEFGVLFHIEVCEADYDVKPEPPFLINSPGHYNRINAGALLPKSQIEDIKPRKLGHSLLFSPDIDTSKNFLIDILGMRLSDRSQDLAAFLHCQGGSDHHVLALAKSNGIGFHHASFMVGSPDEVGIAGGRMVEKGYQRGWGFGRHAVGSNFFYYVQDPWGSFAEYYADIDFIGDSDNWEAQNWPAEDALHTWGPNPPEDMVHNYELDETPYQA